MLDFLTKWLNGPRRALISPSLSESQKEAGPSTYERGDWTGGPSIKGKREAAANFH